MDNYAVNNYWLKRYKDCTADIDKDGVIQTINDSIIESPAYQSNARRNGISQPLAVTRTESGECNITVMYGDEIYIGDLIEVFGEVWLCTDLHTDEYGISYGTIKMCNHKISFQDYNGVVIAIDAIIESGSYSKGDNKALPAVDGTYRCYLPLNEKTSRLYVDKRLALGITYDSKGKEILEVGKITWIDRISNNRGNGSHLLFISLTKDVFNEEKDNLDIIICDYIPEKNFETTQKEASVNRQLVINGRDSIRIGTTRTFKVTAVDGDGNNINAQDIDWEVTAEPGIIATSELDTCTISVPLWDALIGTDIIFKCSDRLGRFVAVNKKVEVISIG